MSGYHSLKCELDTLNKIQSDDEKVVEIVVSVAKKINTEIKSLTSPMSRPPNEQDLYPDRTMLYIPHLLDIFCMVVIGGKLN